MTKYKDTLNLPKTSFPIKLNNKREEELVKQWEEEELYDTLNKIGNEEFVLHWGPPYSNGPLHFGHMLNGILKDIVAKFNSLNGKRINLKPGFDCHGLPIEAAVDKELGSKKHSMSKTELHQKYREHAEKYVEIQKEQFRRLGIVADWNNPYKTMDEDYRQCIISELEKFEKAGLIYKDLKPVFWCPIHLTALAQSDIEYKEHVSKSIFVTFKVCDEESYFAVWTTTPWTLLANKAVAINKNELYVKVKFNDKVLYVANNLVEKLSDSLGDKFLLLERPCVGSALKHLTYIHPIDGSVCPLVFGDHVTVDSGTGFVHIAPGHGEDDFIVGKKHNLDITVAINDKGKSIYGLNVSDTTDKVIEELKDNVLLIEPYTHSYPYSTRSHRPVIVKATDQWFINIDKSFNNGPTLRERSLNALDSVKWIPEHGYNRIKRMLEDRPDWCISRQRSWGVPITINGKEQEDILDVWFDSGVSNAAVMGGQQVDLYLEGSDQHRGWFQSSLLAALGAREFVPYKAVLTHGFVVDSNREKLAKTKKNYTSPSKSIDKYCAETLRLWAANSEFKNDIRISDEILSATKKIGNKIRNTVRYMISVLNDFDIKNEYHGDSLLLIDRYILNKWKNTFNRCIDYYNEYEFHSIVKSVENFCIVDLSSLYFEAIKDRLYCNGQNWKTRRSAQFTLSVIAHDMIQLMAPIMSFTMDDAWRHFTKDSYGGVFLSTIFTYEVKDENFDVIEEILRLRKSVNVELEKLRSNNKIGSSSEANISINGPKEHIEKYNIIGLADIFGVSNVYFNISDEIKINIERAECNKCERCWKYDTSVKVNICNRCKSVLKESGIYEDSVS